MVGPGTLRLDKEEFPIINKRLTADQPLSYLRWRPHGKNSGNVLIKKP